MSGNFLENVSRKRMITFITALLGFSILIFVVEEYVEETDYDGDFEVKTFKIWQKDSTAVSQPPRSSATAVRSGALGLQDDDCHKREPFVVLERCMACTDFEMKALKTKHCLPSGYFDRINCTKSGILTLRPCTKMHVGQTSSFYAFVVCNVIMLGISSVIALKRKEVLDRHAYIRLQQQFN